jgi:hypothetical protein
MLITERKLAPEINIYCFHYTVFAINGENMSMVFQDFTLRNCHYNLPGTTSSFYNKHAPSASVGWSVFVYTVWGSAIQLSWI